MSTRAVAPALQYLGGRRLEDVLVPARRKRQLLTVQEQEIVVSAYEGGLSIRNSGRQLDPPASYESTRAVLMARGVAIRSSWETHIYYKGRRCACCRIALELDPAENPCREWLCDVCWQETLAGVRYRRSELSLDQTFEVRAAYLWSIALGRRTDYGLTTPLAGQYLRMLGRGVS